MKKGITALTVVIMLVIIIVLAGTITINSYNSIQSANKLTFSLEISNIQEEVTRYIKESASDEYPTGGNVYTVDLSDVTDTAVTQFDEEPKDSNNQITLYEVDLTAIGIDDTEFGNKESEKDVYVLSKETGIVYYLEGVKYDGMTYYTLIEDLIDIDDRNEKTDEVDTVSEAPVITFNEELIVNTTSSGDKEIYLSGISVAGEDVVIFKYEVGIITEANAKEYFSSNGKSISSDRIKLTEESDITLYAENSDGTYSVKYFNKST